MKEKIVPIKLAILFGGTSNERAVSMLSFEEVIQHINKNKYIISEIEVNDDNAWINSLMKSNPNIVLNLLHGGKGENGSVQGVLESLRIPYVGSKVMASSIVMNKEISKQIMNMNNIPIVDGLFLKNKESENIINYENYLLDMGYPFVVKPNNGGSSIGISIVKNFAELQEAIEIIKNLDDDILVEKYIDGQEVTCGIIQTKGGIENLRVLNINTRNEFYNYKAKYQDLDTYIEFSDLPKYLQVSIKEIAKKTFECLGCEGYARIDMIVDDEQVYVLEANTLPGLTKQSLITKAVKLGMGFEKFIDTLINFELGK